MKKILFVLALICSAGLIANAKPTQEKNKEKTKGFQFVSIPTIGYNTDWGLNLGALFDLYYYGKDSHYPNYTHKFYIDAGFATRGSKFVHAYFDSPSLIHNIRMTVATTYNSTSSFPFMGFNGLSSPYYSDLDLNKTTRTAFYSVHWNMLRIMANFQGRFTENSKLNWIAGMSYYNYRIKPIESKNYDQNRSLYKEYIKSGIISAKEAKGGNVLEFKAGISYDTRDIEANPNKGIWAEAYFIGSPDVFTNRYHNIKFAAHYRQYISLIPHRLTFAYHLAYQGLLWGETPFYTQQEIATILLKSSGMEGLGGRNTIRGVMLSRLIGNGYIWGNFELRLHIFDFLVWGKRIGIGINPLFDMGEVIQPYRLKQMTDSHNDKIYSGKKEKLHASAGCGIKISANHNFIVSLELAKPFEKQDGKLGLNFGLNYIF